RTTAANEIDVGERPRAITAQLGRGGDVEQRSGALPHQLRQLRAENLAIGANRADRLSRGGVAATVGVVERRAADFEWEQVEAAGIATGDEERMIAPEARCPTQTERRKRRRRGARRGAGGRTRRGAGGGAGGRAGGRGGGGGDDLDGDRLVDLEGAQPGAANAVVQKPVSEHPCGGNPWPDNWQGAGERPDDRQIVVRRDVHHGDEIRAQGIRWHGGGAGRPRTAEIG